MVGGKREERWNGSERERKRGGQKPASLRQVSTSIGFQIPD